MALIKTQNAEGGSDARYDVSQMTPEERTQFDGEGRPLGSSYAPDQWTWTPGIIGARGGGDPNSMGGGGGGGGGGAGGGAFYEQLKSMLQAQGTSQLSDTQAAIRKALIGFGLDPSGQGYEDKLGVLDPVTKSLIAKNTESGVSYYARLLEHKKDNLRALLGNLSQRGMRRSGEKGAKLRRGQLDFDRLFQDSLQELLGQVGSAYQGYAGGEQARQMQLFQALQGGSGGNVYTGASGPSPGAPSPGAAYTTPYIRNLSGGTIAGLGSLAGSGQLGTRTNPGLR